MRRLMLLVLAMLFIPAGVQVQASIARAELTDALEQRLATHLHENHQNPEDYVVQKFLDHDFVFLGENHWVKHDVQLVQDLIPRLHSAGVYHLAIEFANYEDQAMIDDLLLSPVYDEESARRVFFSFMPTWGYQEYVDILFSAWQLNQGLSPSTEAFRILALGATRAEQERLGLDGDRYMAQVVLQELVSTGTKALIYCGAHHAFTHFHQPRYNPQLQTAKEFVTTRLGNIVYQEVGDRAITILLHSPWPNQYGYEKPRVLPADGLIDQLMPRLPAQYQRVGFDIAGTPFAELSGEFSMWKHGISGFCLADVSHGWVYQKPLTEYEWVTPIPRFVNFRNLREAKARSNMSSLSAFWTLPFMFRMATARMGDKSEEFSQFMLEN